MICGTALLAAPVLGVIAIVLFGASAPQQQASAATAPGLLPEPAATAYQRAAGRCPGLDWTLLAAVGAVETRHGQANGSHLDPQTGEAQPWIFGPKLDGTNNTAAMPIDRWAGWWGLTGPWLQAVGPMQFLPATFAAHAVNADGDGATNPHDLDDAAATAAAYICSAASGTVDGPDDVSRIYNPGDPAYADRLAQEQRRILDASTAPAGSAGSGSASICPVTGTVEFTDTYGAPRSGGRRHQGVDIFAPTGTPVVAPADGTVEHYNNQLGGLSYRLFGDDGTYYYGTHLSAEENQGAGHVTAGTTIGYVGTSGNAAGTPPHLHWEIHPDGQGTAAINPTPTAEAVCRPG
ncbi:MAG: M23 family metallopeptidase [Acidimicrobiales bacterium]